MNLIKRAINKVSRLSWTIMMATGLTLAIAAFAQGDSATVKAECRRDIICGCVTYSVRCISGCSNPNRCIWETGSCSEEMPGFGHPFCGFSFCSEICGVSP